MGHGPMYRLALESIATAINPKLLLGVAVYFPLLNRMRDNIVTMGLKEEKLYEAMAKFEKYGGETPEGRRNPWYQVMRMHGKWVVWHSQWPRRSLFYSALHTGSCPVPGWVSGQPPGQAIERFLRTNTPHRC